ncbi:flippase-like domain-containing protein [Sphingobacterium sp. SRCM116780]|uniref:lysylphosphatidylglycerol synthase transmembrane domain-containing protein n=1 Tax=Sphingobacterium sp. SRCM116780 TaxID=2907623 RepID=UPI001F2100AD|nr:lysylphosphatidylglycerol synthase transmembrane domain-containing protein [Sphingobacterium sp. SRCM116780]UIR55415.1 flippase-like domain-containing protein [Sphingobacterium sp. SRCM116780]
MDKKLFWKIIKNILKVVVTVAALYWVFSKVSIQDLKDAVLNSNPIFLLLAFLAYAISILISSSRLLSFLTSIGLNVSEKYNFKLYQLGLFYNLFLPGGVGGDGYKIYFLRKKFSIKGRKLLSALFFDRLSGLWALCLIIAALVIFIPQLGIPNYLTIAGFVLGTILYYFLISKFFTDFKSSFIKTHLKAIGVQSMQVVSAIMILYALGFDGKFSPYLFLFLASSLVAIIPFSVGGLGMREMVYIWGANFFHLDPHLAVLISLLFYIISALMALTGSYYIFHPSALGTEKLPSVKEVEESQTED